MRTEKEIFINDILKTIAYFDVFNYPLTSEQIYKFLPRNSAAPKDIKNLLEEMVQLKLLARQRDFFCLPTSEKNIVEERSQNEKRAVSMAVYARLATRLLKLFPFVRAVFITGSLSKNVAAKGSDIDFMIVTLPHRLWICKTLISTFRKIFLLGSHKYFCTNYYVTEKNFLHPDRNMFSAIELATTKAAWNTRAFQQYLNVNSWIKNFLPNYITDSIEKTFVVKESRSFFQRIFEVMLSIFPLKRIDNTLMNYYRRYWNKRYRNLSAEKRASLFRTTPDVSTVWKNDYQESVLSRYHKKMYELGLL